MANLKKRVTLLRVLRRLLVLSSRRMAILGSVAVIAGTLLVTSYNFELLYFIPAGLSSIDDLDHAWSILGAYDTYEGELGVQTGITPEDRGFRRLLVLLDQRQGLSSSAAITEIQVSAHMLYGNDMGKIGSYVVQVVHDGEPEPCVVAWVEDVSRWIEDERLRWSLSCGFPVLFLGLGLSFVALLFPAWLKDREARGGSSRSTEPMTSRLPRWYEWLPWAALMAAVVALVLVLVRPVRNEWSTMVIAFAALTQAVFAALLWKVSRESLKLSLEFRRWTTDQYRLPLNGSS